MQTSGSGMNFRGEPAQKNKEKKTILEVSSQAQVQGQGQVTYTHDREWRDSSLSSVYPFPPALYKKM